MNNRQRKKSQASPPVRIEPAAKSVDTKSLIMDMFANQLARTGMGGQNLMNATEYELTRITRNYQLLTTLYRENWIVKKIINTIPEDMCKNWIEITSQMSPEMLKRYQKVEKKTKIKSKILTALYWSRLFGGSAAVMLISGQEDLSNPLDIDSIMPGDFKGLMVLDRWMGIYPEPEIISDIDDPDYGLPEYYQIKDEATSTTVRIHHSRMLRFPGRELPIWEQMAEMYWGASELEHIFEEIAKRDNTSWNIASLIFKMSILAVNTEGMDALLSLGDIEAQREFYQTQQAINTMMNNNSMLLLGANDKMQQLQYTFTGVSDVYQNFMLDLSGASEIPATKLFGREPAGMNSTGESDMDNYNNLIENQQESKLRPPLEQLLPVMFMSEFGFVPDDLEFRFKPVQTPNESDIADLVSKKVGSIKDVYDSGIINQQIAMKELKAMSDSTGMFTNITDEDIEMASTDFTDESMMSSLGAGFGQNNSNPFGPSVMDGGPGSGRHPEGYSEKKHDDAPLNFVVKNGTINISGNVYATAIGKGRFPLTKGSQISGVKTFAGKGTKTPIRVASGLSDTYGGDSSNWKKNLGFGYADLEGKSCPVELHWFENEGVGHVEMKVKRWL